MPVVGGGRGGQLRWTRLVRRCRRRGTAARRRRWRLIRRLLGSLEQRRSGNRLLGRCRLAACLFQLLQRRFRRRRTRPDVARLRRQRLDFDRDAGHPLHVLAVAHRHVGVVAGGERRVPPRVVAAAGQGQAQANKARRGASGEAPTGTVRRIDGPDGASLGGMCPDRALGSSAAMQFHDPIGNYPWIVERQ